MRERALNVFCKSARTMLAHPSAVVVIPQPRPRASLHSLQVDAYAIPERSPRKQCWDDFCRRQDIHYQNTLKPSQPAHSADFYIQTPGQHAAMIRIVRNHALGQVLSECSQGRKPFLQVIIDLTTLEKCGFLSRVRGANFCL